MRITKRGERRISGDLEFDTMIMLFICGEDGHQSMTNLSVLCARVCVRERERETDIRTDRIFLFFNDGSGLDSISV